MAYTIVTASQTFEAPFENGDDLFLVLSRLGLEWHLIAEKFVCVWLMPAAEDRLQKKVLRAIALMTPKPPPKPKAPRKRITVSKRPTAHLIRDKAKRDAKIQELVTAGKIKRVVSDRSPEEWAAMLEDARENPYRSTIR